VPDLHRDAEVLVEVADQAGVEVVAGQPAAHGERLGGGLELGEIVGRALQVIADLLARNERRRTRAVGRGQGLAVAQPGRQVVGGGPRRLVRAVQAEHGARGLGAGLGELAHIDRGQVVALEHGVGERLGEIRNQPAVIVAGKRRHIDAEQLGQLDQEVGRQRPAVGLDQVEVARRDPELARQLDLGQALAAAQPADLGTQALLGDTLHSCSTGRFCH
jgi:hypothetical protein